MRAYDSAQPLVFIHVPKTAGTSVQAVFRGWYGSRLATHYFDQDAAMIPVRSALFDKHTTAAPACVYGHFNRLRGFGTEVNYPDATQFMTILRDPFEMTCSRYHYLKSKAPFWRDQTRIPTSNLAEFLVSTPPNMLNHFPVPITWDNYKAVMHEYFVGIGIMEELALSLSRFARTLGVYFDPAMLQHLNATSSKNHDGDTLEMRRLFEEQYALEQAVYVYACDLFAAVTDEV
jgi:hypothetical protein